MPARRVKIYYCVIPTRTDNDVTSVRLEFFDTQQEADAREAELEDGPHKEKWGESTSGFVMVNVP